MLAGLVVSLGWRLLPLLAATGVNNVTPGVFANLQSRGVKQVLRVGIACYKKGVEVVAEHLR